MTHLRHRHYWQHTANTYNFGMTTNIRKCPAFVNTIHITSIENTDKIIQYVTYLPFKVTDINRTVFENFNPVTARDIRTGD